MNITRPVLLAALCLTLALPAHAADDWATSFADSSRLALKGQRALVLGGDSSAECQQATTALAQALRQGGGAALVLDDKTVGSQAGKPDPEILSATRGSPVDRWVIVRVFDGQPPTAIVTLYDGEGKAANALSVRRGEVLAGTATTALSSAGATGTAIDSVLQVGGAMQEKVDQYYERFLHMGKDIYVTQYSAGTYDVVFQGKYSKRLTNKELYELFADAEVDKKVDDARVGNLISSAAFTGVGTVVAVAGAGLGWAAFANPMNLSLFNDSMVSVLAGTTAITVAVLGAIAAVGGGMGLLMAPFGDDPAVFTPDELRAQVEKHNIRLKKTLGLEGVDQLPLGI
ncbi:MAG: hypothetical protein ABIJ09_17275 [Pseudomonadota bacterium]